MDSSLTPLPGIAPGADELDADYIGEVIDGRYEVVERIAKGGMGDVFLSKDPTRKCYVAIKLLRSTSAEARRRFAVEAEVLSNIQHPHIIRAEAFGRASGGQPYLALEHLEGETLSQVLARGPLPWRDVVEIGVQIAGALHALHVAGVVHRDVKPDNIMLTTGAERSIAKLLDLGLASVGAPFYDLQDARFAEQPPHRTKTLLGRAIGTPAYLPPEAGLCDAEPRLDIYSLGVTLYQLCTQRLPHLPGSPPVRDVRLDTDAPEDLSRLLRAALEPDLTDRLASADHLRRGLEAILAAHPRTPSPTHLFGGSYDRLEVIGVGASAIVFRAADRWLSREVAVKVLRDAEPSDDDAIRFRRAAKILSALHHPSIPPILHFGVDAGQMFAVTELCTGSPATYFVSLDGHLRPDQVTVVGRQLASALAAMHAVGVVYRDLHPGNVLIALGDAPQAWLFDFDHAAVSPEFYDRLTEHPTSAEERAEPAHEKPLQRMGYAAPEVRAGAAFSAASDVFALGLLLYRLLTGMRPFPPEGGAALRPRNFCPECTPGLERLLLSMLSPDPGTRPSLAAIQTALEAEQAEIQADRDRAVASEDRTGPAIAAENPGPSVEPVAALHDVMPAIASATAASPAIAPTRFERARVLLIVALVVTVLVVLGYRP